MNLTINSTAMKQPVDFCRSISGYIYVDLSADGSKPGSLGCHICEGGNLIGRRISYAGESNSVFAGICRDWFRAYLRR